MPRYIDADNLIEEIKVERANLYMEGLRGTPRSYEYLNQLQNKLEDAETVDAIPIEWIEQYIENEIEGYGCEIPETNAIKNMLEDWRKENESNSNS